MKHLDNLLNKKIERERLGAGGVYTASSSAAAAAETSSKHADGPGAAGYRQVTSAAPRVCWLCNGSSPLRFRLQGGIHLCFTCFRASYLSLLLPIINTSARRASDAKFLKLICSIENERTVSMSSSTDELLTSTCGEVIEPQQASFVMSSSMMRLRLEEEQQRLLSATQRTHSGGATSISKSVKSFWNCPLCTFLNVAVARECEACGFVNPGVVTCPFCKACCSIGMIGTPLGEEISSSRCKTGEPHCIWNCRECGGLNTLDGDRCTSCHQPRYWACSQCTALHHMARGEDGLRYCPTCGAYNTPDDILVGQAKIDKETMYAGMVTAQQSADLLIKGGNKAHDNHRNDSRSAVDSAAATKDDDKIVFGVNDAQTLEELDRQKQIEDNEKRLLSRLNQLHISRNLQKTDGNCLFSALANQLFGQPRLHYLVRSLATAYMSEHQEDYSILFDGPAEWKKYLTAMKEQGTWGDELCLNAAARCFRVNIHVITSDQDRWHIVFQHDQLGRTHTSRGDKAAKTNDVAETLTNREDVSLFLAYLSPVHYDDITPSPVAHLQLGELLSGELNRRMKRNQTSHSLFGSGNLTSAVASVGLKGGGRWEDGSKFSCLPSRSLLVEPGRPQTKASDDLLRSCRVLPAVSNATAPLVPRSRPSSCKTDTCKTSEPPSRPPPTSPTSERSLPSEYKC
ncbi:hypothetical protein, conserved [Leishmania tarentolae]|uniref:OTU domain-containing protein n=1 Tax=Leishmania tarentolae TaxID=5689 RepID=A0A640KSZ1_LEITA|nr:hypothetical protein, conserved [Leishmania tarentolae]